MSQTQDWKKLPSFLKVFVVGFFIVMFLSVFSGGYVFGLIGYPIHYSDGDRVGQVVKFSDKGIFWKTWEGELALTQSLTNVGSWEFSINRTDPNQDQLVKEISSALSSGAVVEIHYDARYGALPWHGETSYFVTSVKVLDRTSPLKNSAQ